MFGGGEGLADLGGEAATSGDGERGAGAAQGDLQREVVAADDQEHTQCRVIAHLVAQVVVDELDVEVELADDSP